MKPWLRLVLAVVAGFVVGSVVNMGIILLGSIVENMRNIALSTTVTLGTRPPPASTAR